MEEPTAETMGRRQGLFYGSHFSRFSPARSLSSTTRCLLLTLIAATPEMGRKPWATRDQIKHLQSFVPLLQQAKETTGLTTLYAQVYDSFVAKRKPEPVVPKPGTPLESCTPEALEVEAKKRLQDVRIVLNVPYLRAHSFPAHLELVQGGVKEVEVLNPPVLQTGPLCPRLVRQVEA